jgi:hypothetical protein
MDLHNTSADEPRSETPENIFHQEDSRRYKTILRFVIFSACTCLILVGRLNLTNLNPSCAVDKLMDSVEEFNHFIENNPSWRNALQILCSAFMDIMFISTGIFWILKGTTGHVIYSTLTFYIGRAIVQALWFSPFPSGYYWWMDPGIPSLVVPYGHGSDFFFSGHIGFVVICASEWKKTGHPIVASIIALGGVYTAFILLAYHVHYSIDLFVGATFAHYVYIMVGNYKESVDRAFLRLYSRMKSLFGAAKMEEVKKKSETEQGFL